MKALALVLAGLIGFTANAEAQQSRRKVPNVLATPTTKTVPPVISGFRVNQKAFEMPRPLVAPKR